MTFAFETRQFQKEAGTYYSRWNSASTSIVPTIFAFIRPRSAAGIQYSR